MKEMEEDWTAFVRYRIEKADETYHAAQVLYEAAQWNSVVNRLYYACFYVASLSCCIDILPQNHTQELSDNFLKTLSELERSALTILESIPNS